MATRISCNECSNRFAAFARRVCLSLACSAALSALWGGTIVGYDSVGPEPAGVFYSIDAQTGAATAIGSGSGIALSSGPVADTILYSTGVNTYELNVATGQRMLYACTSAPCSTVGDHAVDSDTGTVYALETLYPLGEEYPNPVTTLFRLIDSGVPLPGFPDSTQIDYIFIGTLAQSDITLIEYVPGIGLIGTDGYAALYRINTSSGQTSLLTPLSIVLPVDGRIASMNGLAYDRDTRRLLGSAPYGIGFGGIALARLYNININEGDPAFGSAELLNETLPSLTGIAAVTPVPEPDSVTLLAVGLVVGICAQRYRRRCSRLCAGVACPELLPTSAFAAVSLAHDVRAGLEVARHGIPHPRR